MRNPDELLATLRGEVTHLVADLVDKVGADPATHERLHGEWKHAFDAQRTGHTFEAWRDDRLTQVAVAWVLACVFVRFGEDNQLIGDARLAGPGERGGEARAAQQAYFAAHPHDSDREYFHDTFTAAAELPGLGGMLSSDASPLWLVDPPADACTRLLGVFRATDAEGELQFDFTDPQLDTRFLGDLYQDLSDAAKKDYALLQTPEFVEEFILDRTLDPALETYGLAATTLIDPTCGSGHFLLGGFDRLFQAWRAAEPGESARLHAERALAAVTGVDVNPFAAAIARFRLLVAACRVSGISRLADAPDFRPDVAVGDSLLWGAPVRHLEGTEAGATGVDRHFTYSIEHSEELRRIFDRRYSAVVGNPPYIIARDKALNRQYRERYPDACKGKYSLAAPFMQLFFELAQQDDGYGRSAGYVGMITANSFMKRGFGSKLIERLIPGWDLTHVIDTSGAYIPGHGTPTVILFGRHQKPVLPTVRAVLGIRGEPATPDEPAKGKVWRAIVDQVDEPGSESDWVSVEDSDRARFAQHPWSVRGGGAAELKVLLDGATPGVVDSKIESIGFHAITGEDQLFTEWTALGLDRHGIDVAHRRAFVPGDVVRNWSVDAADFVLYPYDEAAALDITSAAERLEWPYRSNLAAGLMFGKTRSERGLHWAEYVTLSKDRSQVPLSIAFAFVATHNHFVLDHGGKVFKQSAPVIKLPKGASVDDHLALLGPLNSSTAGFWMQQVFHNKGASVDTKGARQTTVAWDNFYEHDGTKLKQFPLPPIDPPVELARSLDSLANELADCQPDAVVTRTTPTKAYLEAAHAEAKRIRAQMVSLQEELDWACLHAYGLTDEALTVPDGAEPPPLVLGERAFEIILARKVAAGDTDTAWFTRHRSTPITEVPSHWPEWYRDLVQRRIDLIESDRNVGLIERPEHKRRWSHTEWDKLEAEALRTWLCDRLEDRALWFEGTGTDERAVARSVAHLADRIQAVDPDWLDVARLYKGAVEIDPVAVITELVATEHVPAQSGARYKAGGFAKRRQWERTWELQRRQDAGQPLPEGLDRIPVPPKYKQGDFAHGSYWKLRGKLDVPKERFVSLWGAERDNDPTMVLAWAGFDHAEMAQAIGTVLVERQQIDGWDADRCWPLIVALAEQLPWLAQWHHDVDARWGDSPANIYTNIAQTQAQQAGHHLADSTEWRPPATSRGRKKKKDQS